MNQDMEESKEGSSSKSPQPPVIPKLEISNETIQAILAQNGEMMKLMSSMIETLSINKTQKVIPPGKYRTDSGETLVQFLERFEEYCKKMYPGSTEGRLPLLGSHLEGPVLHVYRTIASSAYCYEDVKVKLLQWYKDELAREQKSELEKFMEATLQEQESAAVYALRLENLAQKAFPGGSDVRGMKIVRKRFLDSLPHQVKTQVEATLDTVESTLGIQVPWERLVTMVDNHLLSANRKEKLQPEIIDLTESSPINIVAPTQSKNCCCHSQTTYRLSTTDMPPQSQVPRERGTEQGAIPKQPYRNSQRQREWTPTNKFTDNRSRKTSPNQNHCQFCKKQGHTMSQCKARPFCQYCGKRGHTFETCYVAQNKCLHCQQEGHIVQNCPKRNNNRLNCPLCEGEHLGQNCDKARRLN